MGYTYRHTDGWKGFMFCVAEMGSGAMIYIPSFIKTGSGIQKVDGVREIQIHTHWVEESGLKERFVKKLVQKKEIQNVFGIILLKICYNLSYT
jgi:hypothetical protein